MKIIGRSRKKKYRKMCVACDLRVIKAKVFSFGFVYDGCSFLPCSLTTKFIYFDNG